MRYLEEIVKELKKKMKNEPFVGISIEKNVIHKFSDKEMILLSFHTFLLMN